MVKEIAVVPDFVSEIVDLGEIPKYQFQRTAKDELAAGLQPEEAAFYLELMLTVRAFEEMIVDMKGGKFKPHDGFSFTGATHLSIGQEAVAVGANAAIAPTDYITSTHRGHGHSIAKGTFALRAMTEAQLREFLGDPKARGSRAELHEKAFQLHLHKTMAELLGKEEGYCRGRGGGMHIADFHVGHLGANAIVGGSYAIATGAALAAMRLEDGRITLCFVGDGAANNGIAHESYNFACMSQFKHGLPVIYLVENNQYGMTGQQRGEVTGVEFLARRGAGYNDVNMHAEVVNGMDVLAVRDAVLRAAERCRAGDGPVLIECMTYRYMGHSLSDMRTTYRTPEEEAAWKEHDAIATYRAQLLAAGALTEDEVRALEERARERIRQAALSAAAGADPDPATIYEGLFSDTSSEGIGDEYRTTRLLAEPRRARRDSQGRILYRHAVNEALAEEMLRDRRVIFFGEDIADYGGAFQVTPGLLEAFGRERVFNTAISEAAIAGVAAGASMAGLRPVGELMYIDFILLAMDQIGNQVAKARYMFGGKAKLPLVIRTTVGGGKGYAGQHSQSLEAVVTQFPGLKVVMPSTAYDVKGLLKAAIRDDNPVIFIEHQLLYTEKDEVPEEEYTLPIGVARVRREGADLTIVAYSLMANVALEAAELAEAEGVSVEVVDPRTLMPLDLETISRSVRKTGRALCLCQAPKNGCFAEHIAFEIQRVAFEALKGPVEVVAAHDVPPPMAQTLEKEHQPDAGKVMRKIREMLGR
jgi:2-oxoisovalerate dehydrogenase E1 component